jgi:predicted deacylase
MAGYSETPLLKKLGIAPGARMLVRQEPEDYWDWISPLPEGVEVKTRVAGTLDFVHLFVTTEAAFKKEVIQLKKVLEQNGMIWISWPKKSSKVPTDLTEDVIRNFALKNGLVDVKVCAVDEVWSGLKLVIPVKLRKKK